MAERPPRKRISKEEVQENPRAGLHNDVHPADTVLIGNAEPAARIFDAGEMRKRANQTLDDLKQTIYAQKTNPSDLAKEWQGARLAHDRISAELARYATESDPAARAEIERSVRKELAELQDGVSDEIHEAVQTISTKQPREQESGKEKGRRIGGKQRQRKRMGRLLDTFEGTVLGEHEAHEAALARAESIKEHRDRLRALEAAARDGGRDVEAEVVRLEAELRALERGEELPSEDERPAEAEMPPIEVEQESILDMRAPEARQKLREMIAADLGLKEPEPEQGNREMHPGDLGLPNDGARTQSDERAPEERAAEASAEGTRAEGEPEKEHVIDGEFEEVRSVIPHPAGPNGGTREGSYASAASAARERFGTDDEGKARFRETLAMARAADAGLANERLEMLAAERAYIDRNNRFHTEHNALGRFWERHFGANEYRELNHVQRAYDEKAAAYEKALEERLESRVSSKDYAALEERKRAAGLKAGGNEEKRITPERVAARYRKMMVSRDILDRGEKRIEAEKEKTLDAKGRTAFEKALGWAATQNHWLEGKVGKNGARAVRVLGAAAIGTGAAALLGPGAAALGAGAIGIRIARGIIGTFGGASVGAASGLGYEATLGKGAKNKLEAARQVAATDTEAMAKKRKTYRSGTDEAVHLKRSRVEALAALLAGAGLSYGTASALSRLESVQHAAGTLSKGSDALPSGPQGGGALEHAALYPTVHAEHHLGYEHMLKEMRAALEKQGHTAADFPKGSDAHALLSVQTDAELHDLARDPAHHFFHETDLRSAVVKPESTLTIGKDGTALFSLDGHAPAVENADAAWHGHTPTTPAYHAGEPVTAHGAEAPAAMSEPHTSTADKLTGEWLKEHQAEIDAGNAQLGARPDATTAGAALGEAASHAHATAAEGANAAAPGGHEAGDGASGHTPEHPADLSAELGPNGRMIHGVPFNPDEPHGYMEDGRIYAFGGDKDALLKTATEHVTEKTSVFVDESTKILGIKTTRVVEYVLYPGPNGQTVVTPVTHWDYKLGFDPEKISKRVW